MNINLEKARIFVRPGFTDMRKQINGLASLVQEEMLENPLDGSLYLFLGRGRKRLKVLYWDHNGFCMWYKRLENDHFPWPASGDDKLEIDHNHLAMLLSGIDFWRAHKKIFFEQAV